MYTTDYSLIGNHDFDLHVGLKDFATATEAVVRFSVMVAPCIVQSYDAPVDYRWNYVIGSRAANYFFNYA